MEVRLLVDAPHLDAVRGDVVDVSAHEAEVWLMLNNAVPVDVEVEPLKDEESVNLDDLMSDEDEGADNEAEAVSLEDLDVSDEENEDEAPAADDEDFFSVS